MKKNVIKLFDPVVGNNEKKAVERVLKSGYWASGSGEGNVKKISEVQEDDLILDIGPETLNLLNKTIENSRTVLWNGPAGYFENENFKKGSLEIAKKIVEKNKKNEIYSVAGGGDTVAALNSFDLTKYFNFVSTAGGAFLEFLEGKDLPGIKALN